MTGTPNVRQLVRDDVVIEGAVDDQARPPSVTRVFEVTGELVGELADDGRLPWTNGGRFELPGEQNTGHLGERQSAWALAGRPDLGGGGVVAGKQSAYLLHRRLASPAHRPAGQERDDLPEQAACRRPRFPVEGGKRPGRREASPGEPGHEGMKPRHVRHEPGKRHAVLPQNSRCTLPVDQPGAAFPRPDHSWQNLEGAVTQDPARRPVIVHVRIIDPRRRGALQTFQVTLLTRAMKRPGRRSFGHAEAIP